MNNQELRIKLLELEIAALRSVLSEYGREFDDKTQYSQWITAEAISRVLEVLK